MNIKVNSNKHYSCNICNKNYSSKSSLCNHTKKIHKQKITDLNCLVTENIKKTTELVTENKLKCKTICKKIKN